MAVGAALEIFSARTEKNTLVPRTQEIKKKGSV